MTQINPADMNDEALRALRTTLLRACFDPGIVIGPRGERTLDEWRADACIASLAPLLADIAALRTPAEEAEAKLAEATETYTDEAGTCWSPPTAWSYFAACRALHTEVARACDAADAADAVTADRDRLATELAEARAENARLQAALGCHVQADAYRESFPDNEQDAAHNRKSETWWRLMARCAVPQDDPLHEACSVAALSMPEVVSHRDAVIAKVTAEHGA